MKLTSAKHYNYLYSTVSGVFFINIPFKVIFGSVLGVLCYITGAEARVLEIIGMLLIADLFMGILAAIKHKTLSSDHLVAILYKIGTYLLTLMGINWFVTMCPVFLFVRDLGQFFIASAELVSILENADLLGFKYAKKLICVVNKNVEEKLNKK